VLDPIDGTKGFLRNDQYAVALALVEDGAIQWGFLACPRFPAAEGEEEGALFVAQRGAGSSRYGLDGSPRGAVRVSDVREPQHARVVESVESAHTNRSLSARLKEQLGIVSESLRMDSQAKYAAVAQGIAEIYLRAPNPRTPDYRENIWDHAAGWLVVKEAGGEVTDVSGQPLDWSQGRRLEANRGVVATNGHMHDEVVAALQRLLK
jgi:3'(2'), 5'-bisphosphate nucleotidase